MKKQCLILFLIFNQVIIIGSKEDYSSKTQLEDIGHQQLAEKEHNIGYLLPEQIFLQIIILSNLTDRIFVAFGN